jgi:4-carboxymuconolactone decarboxylase
MSNNQNPSAGQSRIAPLLPSEWTEEQHDAVSVFPHVKNFILSNWPDGNTRGLNGVAVFMNHPVLAKAFLTFNNHIAATNTLSKRICEMLILRIGWLRYSEYEFAQHIVLGKRAGLTDDEIARIQIGPDAPGWDPVDADLLRAVDELSANAFIEDDTWHRLAAHFSPQQLLDLVYSVGCYVTMAMVFNSFKVPFDKDLEPLSPELKARMYATRSNR